MAGPTKNTTFDQLEMHLITSERARGADPETNKGVQSLQPLLDQVQAMLSEKHQTWITVYETRVDLNFADLALDRCHKKLGDRGRSVDRINPRFRVMEILYGGARPSDITRYSGLGVEIELPLSDKVRSNFSMLDSQAADLQPLFQLLPEFDAALADARQKLASHKQALLNQDTLRSRIKNLQAQALEAFAKFHGQLEQIFPRQKDMIDLFFMMPESSHDSGGQQPPQPTPPAA